MLTMCPKFDAKASPLAWQAYVCLFMLLAYFAMLAHEFAPDHAEADDDTACAVCIAGERLDDVTMNSGAQPDEFLATPTSTPNVSFIAPAHIPLPASRSPPLLA